MATAKRYRASPSAGSHRAPTNSKGCEKGFAQRGGELAFAYAYGEDENTICSRPMLELQETVRADLSISQFRTLLCWGGAVPLRPPRPALGWRRCRPSYVKRQIFPTGYLYVAADLLLVHDVLLDQMAPVVVHRLVGLAHPRGVSFSETLA
jgi:hypothetical protein